MIRHGNVLFGLVKPRREGKELLLESSAAMVNVLPRKRIYRMGSSDELETFRAELLKRPLVVQPTVLSGSGFQSINCFFSVDRENWTVMINQTHPKILGRLLMGIDAAKRILRRGEAPHLNILLVVYLLLQPFSVHLSRKHNSTSTYIRISRRPRIWIDLPPRGGHRRILL